MKKAFALCVVLVLLACLVACREGNRFRVVMCVSNQTDHSFSMEYESFDGYRYYNMNLKKTATVDIRVETVKGQLDYVIFDEDGEEVNGMNDVGTFGYGFSLPSGKYRVKVTGHEHQGKFSFSW